MNTEQFDFGNGLVAAHRHENGGGWVADTATVEKTACVSGDAWVSGNARVYGDAKVYGNAQVSGNAWVYGNARVYGDAWVSGDARVYGDARVSGRFDVQCAIDFILPRVTLRTTAQAKKLQDFLIRLDKQVKADDWTRQKPAIRRRRTS